MWVRGCCCRVRVVVYANVSSSAFTFSLPRWWAPVGRLLRSPGGKTPENPRTFGFGRVCRLPTFFRGRRSRSCERSVGRLTHHFKIRRGLVCGIKATWSGMPGFGAPGTLTHGVCDPGLNVSIFCKQKGLFRARV